MLALPAKDQKEVKDQNNEAISKAVEDTTKDAAENKGASILPFC